MTVTDLVGALHRVLDATDCDRPRADVLRALRSALDREAPGWRTALALDGRCDEFKVDASGCRFTHTGLILWQRTDGVTQ